MGLDCLAPQLLFAKYWDELPNFQSLAASGVSAPLRSCDPPITVPAWAAMLTGVDPGTLGVYGFYDRADRTYHKRRLASALSYTQPPLWRIIGAQGLRSRLIGIPQTYPPTPMHGCLVTGCLTPDDAAQYTYPTGLADEVQILSGGYQPDIPLFRALPATDLLARVQQQTAATFRLANAWLKRDDWQFFMLVDMGADRLQHALWRFCCADHPRFVPGHPLQDALRNYYKQLDTHLGALCNVLRPDDILWVVSDHGAQAMHGGFAINQWLQQRGDLVLHRALHGPLQADAVDWRKTRAWGEGGYVGRIHFNVAGREPEGTVIDTAALADELQAALQAVQGPYATPWSTEVHTPQQLYRAVHGVAPDLLIYFDQMRQRAIGSLGHPTLYPQDNDTGPDGANHAPHGVVIMRDGRGPRHVTRPLSLFDVAPTVLRQLGVSTPQYMIGQGLD